MNKYEYLVLIPCRSGSKRIKNKNFIKIKNKMLFEYSLEHAEVIKEKFPSSIISISTDSKKIIRKKSIRYWTIPRPKKISGDKSKSTRYVEHAILFFKKKKIYFNNIIILQPTCPIREKKDLINAIKFFNKSKSESLISAYQEKYINENVKYKIKNSRGIPFSKKHNEGTDGKKLPAYYVRNGSIYIVSIKCFEKFKKIILQKPLVFKMNKVNSLNIDTKDDLELIKRVI